jgi:hypothetical protein
MFLQNISKRKVLLLIINALVSVLLISCVLFLYHYLPTSNNTRASIFTIEKGNGVHITKSHHNPISGTPTRSVIVANVKSPYTSRRPIDRFTSSEEEAIDDTIYIDNDSYGDENENYDINSNKRTLGSITTTYQQQKQSKLSSSDDSDSDESYEEQQQQKQTKTPVTIIERPVERSPASDDDLYYENYEDETDDEDIVSSGDGKIIVNVKNTKKSTKKLQKSKKKLQKQRENKQQQLQPSQPEPANYIENVYSVSSEIVSNLKSQYNVDDNGKQQTINQQQQQQSDDNTNTSNDDEDIDDEQPSTVQSDVNGMKNGKRLTGNNKKLAERSRQLILCRSANMGELCRMLN